MQHTRHDIECFEYTVNVIITTHFRHECEDSVNVRCRIFDHHEHKIIDAFVPEWVCTSREYKEVAEEAIIEELKSINKWCYGDDTLELIKREI